MSQPKEPKTQKMRLEEGIALLTKLKETGMKDNTMIYLRIKKEITNWITTGKPFDDVLDAPEFGRVAEISLPRYNNKVAEICLKVKQKNTHE
jgi:hypothetical protein